MAEEKLSRPQRRELEALVETGRPTKPVKGTNGMGSLMQAMERRGLVAKIDGEWKPTARATALWAFIKANAPSCMEPDCTSPALSREDPYCETHTQKYDSHEHRPPTTRASHRKADVDESGPGVEGAHRKNEG